MIVAYIIIERKGEEEKMMTIERMMIVINLVGYTALLSVLVGLVFKKITKLLITKN